MADNIAKDASKEPNEKGNMDSKVASTPNEKPPITLDEPFKNVQSPNPTSNALQTLQGRNVQAGAASNMVTPLENLGEEPAWIDCPHCEKRTLTKVEKNDSSQTTIAGVLCCLFCGVIFACIPCLCHWCADVDHRCSECGKPVAHKPYEGQTQPRYPQGPINRPSQYAAMPANQRARLELPQTQSPPPAHQEAKSST